MSNMNKKQRSEFSIKAVVDLIKDIGYGITLIGGSLSLVKNEFFSGKMSFFLAAVFVLGFLIVTLSPIEFHMKYFDNADSLLKRVLSLFTFIIVFSPAAAALFCSIYYFNNTYCR